MDRARLSEEVEIRDSHAASGDRHDQATVETIEGEEELEIIRGSGNIFRDLGLPHPDLEQTRAVLAAAILRSLDAQNLTTREAEAKTGIAHSEFSRIRNVKLRRFTLDRLFVILSKLDPDVRVVVEVQGLPDADDPSEDPSDDPGISP